MKGLHYALAGLCSSVLISFSFPLKNMDEDTKGMISSVASTLSVS